jgi:glycine cleavage system pyridoxal-binding protein P
MFRAVSLSIRYVTNGPALIHPSGAFASRHIGPSPSCIEQMCKTINVASLDALVDKALPPSIRLKKPTTLGLPLAEHEALSELRVIASKNKVYRTFIGMGYNSTRTPGVVLRNVLENPSWYTQYTPYQPEISQGRLGISAFTHNLRIPLEFPDNDMRPNRNAYRKRVATR